MFFSKLPSHIIFFNKSKQYKMQSWSSLRHLLMFAWRLHFTWSRCQHRRRRCSSTHRSARCLLFSVSVCPLLMRPCALLSPLTGAVTGIRAAVTAAVEQRPIPGFFGIQNGAWCDVLSAHRCLLPLSSSSLPTQFLRFTLRQDSLSCALSPV